MTRRSRRRVEAVLVMLAFPLAVALTVAFIATSATGSATSATDAEEPPSGTGTSATVGPRVAVRGGAAVPAFGLADTLASRGYDVIAVTPDENSLGASTRVVYYQRDDRGAAEQLRDVLGVGTITREQVFSPSSDMTIIIGKDLQST